MAIRPNVPTGVCEKKLCRNRKGGALGGRSRNRRAPLALPVGMHRDAARVQISRARRTARTLAHLLGERTSAPLCVTTPRHIQAAKGKSPRGQLRRPQACRFGQPQAGWRGAPPPFTL